jgi:hypothetical protein
MVVFLIIVCEVLFDYDRSRVVLRYSKAFLMSLWGVVLAIDFLISYSYTLFPRKNQKSIVG